MGFVEKYRIVTRNTLGKQPSTKVPHMLCECRESYIVSQGENPSYGSRNTQVPEKKKETFVKSR